MKNAEYNELYSLYLDCFPEYPIREQVFFEILKPEKATIICEKEKGKLIGFSLLHHNSISIICVDYKNRNKGIGSRLLNKSEEYIGLSGADKIILGNGSHYLIQGVPDDKYSSVDFFKSRGYSALWTSVNMELELEGFSLNRLNIPPCDTGITFRFIEKCKHPLLLQAVKDAMPGWLEIFADCPDPILIADNGKKIVGFEILSRDGGYFISGERLLGSIGCVGVIHEARNSGIGMQLVAHGINWLKEHGCRAVELRYVALVDWYQKLGFKVVSHQWMGEKSL